MFTPGCSSFSPGPRHLFPPLGWWAGQGWVNKMHTTFTRQSTSTSAFRYLSPLFPLFFPSSPEQQQHICTLVHFHSFVCSSVLHSCQQPQHTLRYRFSSTFIHPLPRINHRIYTVASRFHSSQPNQTNSENSHNTSLIPSRAINHLPPS